MQIISVSPKDMDKFERRRLKKVAQRLRVQNVGVIIRTVAEGKSEQHIENDFNQLIESWNKIENKADHESAPALVYEDLETASSVVRDLLTPDVEKIIIDSNGYLKKPKSTLRTFPSLLDRLELYKLKSPF